MSVFSYDFSERWFGLGPWHLAFRVYTEENVYTPDPNACDLRELPDGWLIESPRYAWAGGQQTTDGLFRARIERVEQGIAWTVDAALHARIKAVSSLVRGVDRGDVLNRRLEFESVEAAQNVQLQYPTSMPVPIFTVRHSEGDATVAVSDDDEVRAKTFYLLPDGDGFLMELHHHEDARKWSTRISTPAWRLTRGSDWSAAMRHRMAIMENAWGIRSWEERPDVPEWMRQVCLVLNLHGTDWTGFIFSDYARQLECIRYVCERLDGRHVLAYLPGWDGRYNYNWPRYEPDDAMGGSDGLKALVRGAHDLGVHVIPQIGAQSANRAFLPPGLHHVGFRDAFGNTYTKPTEWDRDRMPDTYRVDANIGHPPFCQFLIDKTIGLTERFGFDGIFLDINQSWHNDPICSPLDGHRRLAAELTERFDEFLVFGEGWYDALLGPYPLIHWNHQTPPNGVEIFHRYCRSTYHLNHPAPGRGSTGVYESGFAEPFVPDPERDIIPAIAFVDDTLPDWAHEVDLRIEAARTYGRRKGIL